jgi:hypothetical protein
MQLKQHVLRQEFDGMNANPNESNWKALAPSMEANMMTIRHPAAETAEHSARSSLDAFERRPHQTALRRTKAPHRFPLYPLHGDERRAGKTAKLLDPTRGLHLARLSASRNRGHRCGGNAVAPPRSTQPGPTLRIDHG